MPAINRLFIGHKYRFYIENEVTKNNYGLNFILYVVINKIYQFYLYIKSNIVFTYVFFCIRPYCNVHLGLRGQINYVRTVKRKTLEAIKYNHVCVCLAHPEAGIVLSKIVAVAWLFNKLNVDVEFTILHNSYSNHFENSILNYSKISLNKKYPIPKDYKQNFPSIKIKRGSHSLWLCLLATMGLRYISSEFGYKVISELGIKQDIQKKTTEWYRTNVKGQCIGVHYRGTDVVRERGRESFKMDAYINYLKGVLDEDSYIFACSDQAQFITQMNAAFPGRVITRDIRRSHTEQPIHLDAYDNYQQKLDAFMDIILLSKTGLIYTTGSHFVGVTRFLNPSVKIVVLDKNFRYKNIPNYTP